MKVVQILHHKTLMILVLKVIHHLKKQNKNKKNSSQIVPPVIQVMIAPQVIKMINLRLKYVKIKGELENNCIRFLPILQKNNYKQ